MLENLIDDEFVLKSDHIAVGVSGGADSMLLLCALIDKQKQVGFDMVVVHVNHNIREETSIRDAKFVEDFCKKRKINHKIVNIDVKTAKIQEKSTLEETARNLRFDAIKRVMKEEKLNKLFLAHHKNDQAETILMHIFRGSGIDGACGIRQSEIIKRPLLNLSKKEILSKCKTYGIPYVEDETNADNDYSRNFLRNKVIPLIEEKYPSAVSELFYFGKRCEEIYNFICSMINENLITEKGGVVYLKDEAFLGASFLVREYIKKVFEKLQIFADIEAKHYVLVEELQKSEVNKQINLPHKIVARRTYDGISFFKQVSKRKHDCMYQFVVGELQIDEIGKIETKIVLEDEVVYGNDILFVDYNKISKEAVWRTRKNGDIFAKLGTGSKKLNDYFTDKKIDVSLRDNILLLAINNNILVVAGYDISEKVKIDSQTDKIVSIKFTKN